jgi:general secretion pathway protein N
MKRWALWGLLLGALLALPLFAPAVWLASALGSATGERLVLADARGTLWNGSAVLVLTGGPGSRDASALPGRVAWRLGIDGTALALRARHACCIDGELLLRLRPGLGRLRIELPGSGAPLGHWPAAWLAGLGTPWNTLQPAGTLQLASPGFGAERVQGRWVFDGRLELELQGFASSLSTLEELGSYRLSLQGGTPGNANADGGAATLQLNTLSGALQMRGSGQWLASRLQFNGEAQAAPGSEAALNNLLNIIGRRRGALSIISIG